MLEREFIYLWYYFTVLFNQIFPYWLIGILIGSVVSVFGKTKINQLFASVKDTRLGLLGIIPASLLGIASPLCMYGTIPIVASFHKQGMRQDWLAAFMMSSILLNPQLIIYSAALGMEALIIRISLSFVGGIFAGLLISAFYRNRTFFNFSGFSGRANRDTHPNLFIRFLKNLWRNIRATGLYFLIGIILTALFQRYVPNDGFAKLFGEQKGFGVLMAATLGVPVYVCGGGTIPLLMDWLHRGMSLGAAGAFMISGPGTKITNLGALKIALGTKSFFLYFSYVFLFSVIAGLIINLIL
ncbi:permease [Saccharicrinis sp. FJH62]|uniref:permease n=1 Tax=Saccharicrinis sp. FJH62 TaxID=3344657 RepID=UPI0035D4DDC2